MDKAEAVQPDVWATSTYPYFEFDFVDTHGISAQLSAHRPYPRAEAYNVETNGRIGTFSVAEFGIFDTIT